MRTKHRLAAGCTVVQGGAAVAADTDDDDIEVPSGAGGSWSRSTWGNRRGIDDVEYGAGGGGGEGQGGHRVTVSAVPAHLCCGGVINSSRAQLADANEEAKNELAQSCTLSRGLF